MPSKPAVKKEKNNIPYIGGIRKSLKLKGAEPPAVKGQWFLISAAVASGALLVISVLFRDYFVVDPSKIAMMDEDFYFNDIKTGMAEVLAKCPDAEITRKMKEFMEFSRQKMQEKGYMLVVMCSSVDCSADCSKTLQQNFPLVMLKSHRMEVWEGEKPEIENFEFIFSGDILQSTDMTFSKSMGYQYDINVIIYDSNNNMIGSKTGTVTGLTKSVSFAGANIQRNKVNYGIVFSPVLAGETKFYMS